MCAASRLILIFWLGLGCPGVGAGVALADEAPIVAGAFSEAGAGGDFPDGWQAMDFARVDRPTRYELVEEAGQVVLQADSQGSASGLMRSLEVDLGSHPVLAWRWRIEQVLEKGDVTRREGDDYPARLYVAFGYDPERAGFFERVQYEALRIVYGEYPPVAALNYIWASNSPVGTVVPNPYSDRAWMIVVRSGAGQAMEWVDERRDVAADYRRVFGGEPPRVSGVAVMTDTDDTGESARSWFGDIVFEPAAPGAGRP